MRSASRRVSGVVALILVAGACTSTTRTPTPAPSASPIPSATPAGSPVLGRDWGKANLVEQPGSGAATTPPYVNPGSLGHPQHYQGGEADLLAVTSGGPGLVAVGYLAHDITADAWYSTDALSWKRVTDFPATAGSVARAVAANGNRLVAGGESEGEAMTWVSDDGHSWRSPSEQPAFGIEPEARITAVVAFGGGFVAGGYIGSLVGPITAVFWMSDDGSSWTRVADGDAFANARVSGMAVSRDGRTLVAVGVAGDAKTATGSVVWTSTNGRAFRRVATADDLADATMTAVAAGEQEFVAVGQDLNSTRALTWTSVDGQDWTRSPAQSSLDNFGLKIEMHGVAFDGSLYVAGGHRLFGTQFATAVGWTSSDGLTWERAPETAALSQGKIQAVTTGGPGFVAVGNFGAPDFSVPTVWVTPGR